MNSQRTVGYTNVANVPVKFVPYDGQEKSFATTFFSERCSIDEAKCWLCNKIRHQYKGVGKTRFEIWHDDYGGG
ncbi:hypothetical protein PHMEG_00017121 [Phytophthora megakarya]|uniref:Uncharacterized protein n=1 Tax=Phytophthora megakarya TaxID=4795 RepID=A0A225VXJ5_9STRA|nr:hypothetical protein PHMEG_00017121 [Phytophthora megakarya]